MKKLSAASTALLLSAVCSLLVIAAICSLLTAFDIVQPQLLVVTVIAVCTMCCVMFSLRKGWIAFLAFSALMLVTVYFNLELLKESFSALGSFLLGQYNSGYHWFSDSAFSGSYSAQSFAPALLCAAIVMSVLVSFSATYLKSSFLCGMFVLPCIIACFVVTDTVPKPFWLLLVLGTMMLLCLTQHCRRTDVLLAPLSLLYFAVPTVALLAVLVTVAPPERYDPTTMVGDLTGKISSAWEQMRRDVLPLGGMTNPDEVNLHNQKSAPASMRTQLYVTAEETGTLYLCGMAYEQFADDTWRVLKTKNDFFGDPVNNPKAQISISTAELSDVLYYPYGTAVCDADTGNYEAYLENGNRLTDYSVSYLPNAMSQLTTPPTAAYTQYVYENCLALPDDTRQSLLQWGRQHLSDDPSPQEICEAVKNSATYSRVPRAIPNDADLAVYFLNEAESGFCVQFATATAELLRAYGYPSRYMTGYLAEVKAGEQVSVPEKCAHAWTEYYDTSVGWVRLDATPAEGASGDQPQETQTGAPITPSESQSLQTTQPSTQPKDKPQRQNGADNSTEEAKQFHLPAWAWVLLGALLFVGCIIARRFLCLALRQKKLQAGDSNTKLCAWWHYYTKLCSLAGQLPEAQLSDLAQKAGFSQHQITPEELAQIKHATAQLQRQLKAAKLPKRLYYQYILAAV